MKRLLLAHIVVLWALSASAQEAVPFRFGCIAYDEVLTSMPEYAQAETSLAELRGQYDAELAAAEDDFNAKYEAFLNEYENYAPSIMRKRQAELEDIMRRNELFRLESLRLLDEARQELLQPVRERLDAVISDIAEQYSLAFVLNTDSDAAPYIRKTMVYDITKAVKEIVCSQTQ